MTEQSDTRGRIIEATERLFAEGGEDATSLRAITRAADVNVAAIHYHFGGRDGLLREVLDRTIGPLNRRRLELLDLALAAHRGPVPVEELLAAFLVPDLELLGRLQAQFARFLGRAYTQPSPVLAGFLNQQFQVVAARFLPELARALPHLAPTEIEARMRLVVAVVTVLFASAPDPGGPGLLGTADPSEQRRRLVAFCVGGLTTP